MIWSDWDLGGAEEPRVSTPTGPPSPFLRVNVYTCPSGHQTITGDLDEGVTPFLIPCRSGCNETAQSSFYLVDQTLTPAWEWYRPSRGERKRLDRATREHVGKGGLLLRAVSTKQPNPDSQNPPALEGARRLVRRSPERPVSPHQTKAAAKRKKARRDMEAKTRRAQRRKR